MVRAVSVAPVRLHAVSAVDDTMRMPATGASRLRLGGLVTTPSLQESNRKVERRPPTEVFILGGCRGDLRRHLVDLRLVQFDDASKGVVVTGLREPQRF